MNRVFRNSGKKFIASLNLKSFLLLILALAVLISLLPGIFASGEQNLHVHQAKSFLEGRLDIPRYYHDAAVFGGHCYVPFPPFPALVLLPFVALLGVTYTKTVLISIAFGVLSFIVLKRILGKLTIPPRAALWVLAAFFGGTAYWFCLVRSTHVWYYAHIIAVACIFLAIDEVLGRGRGLLAGCFLGIAFLSRQLSLYSLIFLLALLWEHPRHRQSSSRINNSIGFIIPVLLCFGVYCVYNWVRFGDILDTGYYHIYAGYDYSTPEQPNIFLKDRILKYGLFHPAYVPFNFIHMFLQGFHLEFDPPAFLGGIRMNPFGTSLTFASPFVFVALMARGKKTFIGAAWISIGLAIVHMMFYHTNGWSQVNANRYSLDFLPVLILLTALGTNRVKEGIWKAAIVYSIILNIAAIAIYSFGTK